MYNFFPAPHTNIMFNLMIKTVIIYALIILAMRLMGKKEVGQLQPYELVITILIAEIASTPMDTPGTPLWMGLLPALMLLVIYYFISFLTLKSEKMRTLICGQPSILVYNGKINVREFRKLNYNINDLLEQSRVSGISNISDIHYALLETNGSISVFPYAAKQPLTPEQMDMEIEEHDICTTLVTNGHIHTKGLAHFHLEEDELKKIFHTCGFSKTRRILYAALSEDKVLQIQDMDGREKTVDLSCLSI